MLRSNSNFSFPLGWVQYNSEWPVNTLIQNGMGGGGGGGGGGREKETKLFPSLINANTTEPWNWIKVTGNETALSVYL